VRSKKKKKTKDRQIKKNAERRKMSGDVAAENVSAPRENSISFLCNLPQGRKEASANVLNGEPA